MMRNKNPDPILLLSHLVDLRLKVGLTQAQASTQYFESRSRRPDHLIGKWEAGIAIPRKSRREDFIVYLLDGLRLHLDRDYFEYIWDSIMVGLWDWEPLSEKELFQAFPSLHKFIGRQQKVFTAPPRPRNQIFGRNLILRKLRQSLILKQITAVYGLPGIGKTMIALELVHDFNIRKQFSDGVLWAGLGQHANVLAKLGEWAIALEVPELVLAKHNTPETRTKLLRGILSKKRMILIIDDAWSIDDALTLYLGGPECAHFLTTRSPDIGVHFAGTNALQVEELALNDALFMLSELAPVITKRYPEFAEELVNVVGCHPFGILILGNYIRIHSITDSQTELRSALEKIRASEERFRLIRPIGPQEQHPSLSPGVPFSLLSVIDISYTALAQAEQAALRALALFDPKPNSFSLSAAIKVANTTESTINKLVEYGLMERRIERRYTLHKTITDYLSLIEIDYEESIDAHLNLISFYVFLLQANKKDYSLLADEFRNISTAFDLAHSKGLPEMIIESVNIFCDYLVTMGLYPLAMNHLEKAKSAIELLRDPHHLASTLRRLGRVAEKLGEYPIAERYFEEALVIAREMQDLKNQGLLLSDIGVIKGKKGKYDEEASFYQQSLVITRAFNDNENVCRLLANLGAVLADVGKYDEAENHYLEALQLAEIINEPIQKTHILSNIGAICDSQGFYERAEYYFLEGLEIARQINYREYVCRLLCNLGVLFTGQGTHYKAQRFLEEGLALAKEIENKEMIGLIYVNIALSTVKTSQYDLAENLLKSGMDFATSLQDPWIIINAFVCYGELYLAQKRLDMAKENFTVALEQARNLEIQEFVGQALYGLGQIALLEGKIVDARAIGQLSLSTFNKIGHKDRHMVENWLSSLFD